MCSGFNCVGTHLISTAVGEINRLSCKACHLANVRPTPVEKTKIIRVYMYLSIYNVEPLKSVVANPKI